MVVLEAIRHAAVTLQYRNFLSHHGEKLGGQENLPEELAQQLDNCQQVGAVPHVICILMHESSC